MTGVSWLLFVLAVLATARLTRLVVADQITDGVRRWVQARSGENVAYLVTCPWCASPYLAVPVAVGVLWHGANRAVLLVLVVLAASEVTGLIAGWLDPPDDLGDVADG